MRWSFCFVFLALNAFCLLPAEEEKRQDVLSVDAAHVNYDGKIMTLKGNAVVDHCLGHMAAEHMTLSETTSSKKGQFNHLELDDQVCLTFKEGGTLTCAKATLDYPTLLGNFSSAPGQPFVVYRENCKAKDEKMACLMVQSRRMSIHLASDFQSNPVQNSIAEITADEHVTVNYNQEFAADADHAVYHRLDPLVNLSKKGFSGLITMRSAEEGGSLCKITNISGDIIQATEVNIDTNTNKLTFNFPIGIIQSVQKDALNSRVDFTADLLIWDDHLGSMTLKGNVDVYQEGIGNLKNKGEVQIFQHALEGKRSLKAIESQGETVISYKDIQGNINHSLTCFGPMKVDHVKMETKLYSPKEPDGTILEEKQVFFEDARGDIYADNALIQYKIEEGALKPSKIILAGHVKISNRLVAVADSNQTVLQYVLADRVVFYPDTKEMLFKASKGKRVLFFDKVNTIELSAPAIKIIRDKATKKESIQGIGDVRFSFVEHEFEQLRKRFSLDKPEDVSPNNKSAKSIKGAL